MKEKGYMRIKKLIMIFAFIGILSPFAKSQIKLNVGYIMGIDMYHRLTNPLVEGQDFGRSSGSAVLNLGGGLRMYVGGENFSVSAEGLASLGLLGLDINDTKGLGTLGVPLIARLNFKGLSGFSEKFRGGFYVGGGIQYSRTELYGVSQAYQDQGLTRDFFSTYVAEVGFGMGQKSITTEMYIRGGFNPQTSANVLHVGINIFYSFRWKTDGEKMMKDLNIDMEDETYKM